MAFTIRFPLDKEALQKLSEACPNADPKAVDLTVRLMICANELEEVMTHHFQEYDLTQGRFSTMMYLYKHPARKAKPIEIADYLGVTRGNMTGLLDNLERDGMVCREDDPDDRRINYVCLTDQGQKHLKKMLPVHFQRIRKLVEPLSKQERETFLSCLEKLRASLADIKANY